MEAYINSAKKLINNPIYVSFIIIFIMLLMVIVMFKSEMKEEEYNFWILLFRYGLFMSLPIFTLTFFHYKLVEDDFNKKNTPAVLSDITTTHENIISPAGQGYTYVNMPM